ncbi:hypothetical protein C8R44DRAFT_973163 [Mycena epipterygia]|nr:hypothetical protein C8R44DRAFT_973163 [Mycena epipterygia]
MSSASSSTASLVSTTTVSSRAPLTGQPKDFRAAFASLQSSYGFGGSAPSPVPKTTTASRSERAPASSRAPANAPKDFQAAFADLQSTYGFGGSAPLPVPKPKKEGSGSLFAKFARAAVSKAQASPTSTSTPKTKVRHVPPPSAQMKVL